MAKSKTSVKKSIEQNVENVQNYNFPEYGITIEAKDFKDALAKLALILNK